MRFAIVVLLIIAYSSVTGYLGYTVFSNIPQLVENRILLWTVSIGLFLSVIPVIFIGVTVRYQIPKPNTALLITNKSKNNIAFAGGLWVNTIIDKIREIPLNTMRIDIVGKSVLTHDSRRCDVEVSFYLRIMSDESDIQKAAQFFDNKLITTETMQMFFEPKLESILRSVVAESDITDITQKRQKFIDQVHNTCKDDLKSQYGIILEYIDINKVNQNPDDLRSD
ncbi:hypothetical protein C6501_05080 [Candidatus Poribacteria bacterium]|nr:MAG: hypothetical protein C6501_05080 [Candidatus Poribacteria bacterium]